MTKIDYKIERTDNCILIDTKHWLNNSSNILSVYRLSGRAHVNYLTTVLDTNLNPNKFKEKVEVGDYVLLSRIVSDVAVYRAYSIDKGTSYYDVPAGQIMGVFRDNVISFDTLEPLNSKLIMKKVDLTGSSILVAPSDNSTVCEVLKAGPFKYVKDGETKDLCVKQGDFVLLVDNVATKFSLAGEEYLAVDEENVVGIFKDGVLDLDHLELVNDSVLFKEYIPEKIGSLLTPTISYDDLDYTNIQNRDRFKISFVDKNLTKLKKNDIIYINRDVANYVFFNREKYYITNGMYFIEGKELEEKI